LILVKKRGFAALLLIVLLALCFNTVALANFEFYSMVRWYCGKYSMSVDYEDMALSKRFDGNEDFRLKVTSARNDFDRALLVGFYATGKAIEKYHLPVESITIVVSIEYKGVENLAATARQDQVLAFAKGEMTSAQFMRIIRYT
jgi:hypothetical protein